MYHHQSQSQQFQQANQQPECSCTNQRCSLPTVVRQVLETVDNLIVLKFEEQHLLSIRTWFSRLMQERNTRLWRWEREQEDHHSQLLASFSIRPTGVFRANHQVDIMAWRRSDLAWAQKEQSALEARLAECHDGLARLMSQLVKWQLVLTQQELSPACCTGVEATLETHLQKLTARIGAMQSKVEEKEDQSSQLQHQYQQERMRQMSARQDLSQGQALGMSAINTRWFLHALFGMGQSQSLSASKGAHYQVMLTQQFQLTCQDHKHFLWYGREMFANMKRVPTREMLEVLYQQETRWKAQLRNLKMSTPASQPEAVIITPILEETYTAAARSRQNGVVVTLLSEDWLALPQPKE